MSDSSKNDEIIEYLFASILDLQGRLQANKILLNSLLSTICENAPELIEKMVSVFFHKQKKNIISFFQKKENLMIWIFPSLDISIKSM